MPSHEEEQVAETEPVIYIVDDDTSVRRALTRLMRSMGFAVEAFGTAEDFLRVPPQNPGCLILDVRLPGMSGFELQAHLDASGCRLPIIFITAYDDAQGRARAMSAGAVAYLDKPYDAQVLLEAIQTALPEKRK